MGRSIGLWGAALALAVALATLTTTRAEEEPAGEIVWRTDLAAATAEAAKSGRPMLVVFRCER